MTEFSLAIAQKLFTSKEQFPIDFGDAWKWLKYSREDSAKRFLLDNLENLIDFHINVERRENISSSHFGGKQVTYAEKVKLSIEGFKNWAMMSKTETGKQVRKYFLECEKIAEEKVNNKKEIPSTIEYVKAHEYIETINNETLKQLLRDQLIDELSVLRGQKALPEKAIHYTIAKVRAIELGYSTKEIGNGSQLGKFLARNVPIAFSERIGKYATNHYAVDDQLDTAIHRYFGMKKSLAA